MHALLEVQDRRERITANEAKRNRVCWAWVAWPACRGHLLDDGALRDGRLLRLPPYADAQGVNGWLAQAAGPARSSQVERCHTALIALARGTAPAPED